MATCDVPFEEFFESLNGFDEIAIFKAFKLDLSAMEERGFLAIRSCIFVHMRRLGSSDADAYQAAMMLPVKELETYFPESEPEIDPDDPDTESGKDDLSPA